jgi:predicted ATPase/transcriptional regulator with XRE-family HTH domain
LTFYIIIVTIEHVSSRLPISRKSIMPANDSQGGISSVGEQDFPLFFGDWLKRRRKQLDLTQSELADLASCSVFTLRKIEAGERRPSKQLAGMMAKPLEIPPEKHLTFIKVARGEQSLDKLSSLFSVSPPAVKTATLPGNLPRALTPFIGREPEISALVGLLSDPQCTLLTIIGPGGIGKTRLAIEAVHHARDLFPDGVWFVPLAMLNSHIQIVSAIADAVDFKFQDPTNPQAQLLRYLHAKKALLVLDNAEHLLEGAAQFTELLKNCPQMKLLITSRERLNLLSEWSFEIHGLPVPPDDLVKQFDGYSAVALFMQSARRVQAGFALREDERQWVLKICQTIEGMPLGIELSAAWVGILSVEEIAIEIAHNLDFLSASLRDVPERHHSLRATLDHSWKLLSPEEKLILSRLAVFHGRFSRKGAQAICEANLAVLSSLKNKSLLQRVDQYDYSLHEIVRQYAELKLAEQPDEFERIKDRHAEYFVKYLASCEQWLQGSRQVETLDEMAIVVEDLAQGWQHMVTHCRPQAGDTKPFPVQLMHSALFAISMFYEQRCRSLEAIAIFKGSVDNLKTIQHEFETTTEATTFASILAHITAYLGLHYYYLQEYAKAKDCLEGAIRSFDDGQSRVEKAQAQVMLAAYRDIFEELKDGGALLERCREVFREEGVNWWYALSTINLAFDYYSLGKLPQCTALFREAIQLVDPGDLRLGVPARNGYALALYAQDDFAQAEQLLKDSLQLSYRLGNQRQTSYILSYLGRVELALNRVELSEEYHQKSVETVQQFGESHDLATIYLHLGKCLAAKPDQNAARLAFRKVIRIGFVLNTFHLVCFGLVNIGITYMLEGHIDQALEIFLLLRRCPSDYARLREDLTHLQAGLQAALAEGQQETAMLQQDTEISLAQAEAEVFAYAREHELGSGGEPDPNHLPSR